MSKLKEYNGTSWVSVNDQITGDTLPIGSIVPYGSTTAPTGWLVCDGSAVSRTSYSELFAAIGTSFGTGDGSTTFNLPNLKGRVPVGYNSSDSDFNAIGKTGGSKDAVVVSHSHDKVNWLGEDRYPISLNGGGSDGYVINNWSTGAGGGTMGTNTVGESGTGKNLQPYLTVRFIIKAKQSSGVVAQVETSASNSNTNVYSCKYVNDTLSNLIKIKEVAGTTDGNGFLNLNMNLNQYIVLGVRVKIGQDSFANPYNIRGIDGWSVQLKTWDGQNIGSTQFTLEVVYIET